MAISFKGPQYQKSVILFAIFFYLRYLVSYRDLEEIMAERGVKVDHATLNRWVVKYAPLLAGRAQVSKRVTAKSWRANETYIKVRGKWTYPYRAIDRDRQTLDFMLSERRHLPAARRIFFRKAIASNGPPDRVVIDKSGANLAGLQAVNVILKFTGDGPMMGFKAFHSAVATLAGIETAHMIRKGQSANENRSPFQVFARLAG
ncbi:IS6 family transposase [Paracoccus saliphilus]|uniref:Transposase n=1 Tax=Paracoccus saliphilus TaxID=405559 RepID=A0AA46A7P3_9RHOB|nr:IS6 family transposase [Paracoccus saliphilus]WCR02960.1 IS6 family transposase [Paracoccus saliphilus]SIT16507.1 putative transposase [Paracoccus saliphilus]